MDRQIAAIGRRAAKQPVGVPVRMTQLTGAIVAIRMMVTGRHLVEDIADALGLGRRSAYRLLSALEAVGIPIQRSQEGSRVHLSVRREDVERALGLGN